MRAGAIAQLDSKENRFCEWLPHEALACRLKLPAIAGFEVDVLQQVREKLSGRLRPMAA